MLRELFALLLLINLGTAVSAEELTPTPNPVKPKPKVIPPQGPMGKNAPPKGGPANAAAGKANVAAKPAPAKVAAPEKADMAEGAGAKKAEGDPEEKKKPEDLDHIEMLNGYSIYGKISKEFPDSIIMTVDDEKGHITIPKNKIKAMNFSLDTRLGALEADDYAGKYKVGLWAMEKGLYPQAIKLFEFLKDKDRGDTGKDLLKVLGKAYEERGQLDKALEAYNEYLLGFPEDSEIADVAKALEAKVKPKEEEVKDAPKIVDGLEADGNWTAEAWEKANPGTAKVIADASGNKMVAVQSPGGANDKMAFTRTAVPLNLSDSKEMVFKVYNGGDNPINLAVAYVNAQGDFHESKLYRISPKAWVNQTVKIEGKIFKSNRNDFKEWNQDIQGCDHIVRITFLVYGQKPFTLYVDNLFFK